MDEKKPQPYSAEEYEIVKSGLIGSTEVERRLVATIEAMKAVAAPQS